MIPKLTDLDFKINTCFKTKKNHELLKHGPQRLVQYPIPYEYGNKLSIDKLGPKNTFDM